MKPVHSGFFGTLLVWIPNRVPWPQPIHPLAQGVRASPIPGEWEMRRCIYVVDDDDTVTYAISLSLRNDHRVRTFSDAESALEGFEIQPPDVILLDIGLPGMNGIDALKLIKERYPNVLVIMITGYEDVPTLESAMKLGAYDCITKPLHLDSLRLNVQNAIESLRVK
jgi:DNA-binding NtrC family response regulator